MKFLMLSASILITIVVGMYFTYVLSWPERIAKGMQDI